MDGSGRALLRNRCHLRKISDATRDNARDPNPPTSTTSADNEGKPLLIPGQLRDGTNIIDPVDDQGETTTEEAPIQPHTTDQLDTVPSIPQNNVKDVADTNPEDGPPEAPPLRRSARKRNAPKVLSPTMRGKQHNEVLRS